MIIHTLHVHYAHAAANLNSGYSKYVKVARVHYFCTIALRTSRTHTLYCTFLEMETSCQTWQRFKKRQFAWTGQWEFAFEKLLIGFTCEAIDANVQFVGAAGAIILSNTLSQCWFRSFTWYSMGEAATCSLTEACCRYNTFSGRET